MGIIKAAIGAIGGTLADQWLETIEPEQMDNTTLATYGVKVRRNDGRSANRRGTADLVSNGSVIHVPVNTYMLLVDGGKIIAATDEEGYYQVDNSKAPSLFFQSPEAGRDTPGATAIKRPNVLVNTLKDSWERFKFGGTTPHKQKVIYLNRQEIPDIRFGTKTPVPYTDRVLVPGRVVPCKVTSFGTYSIKIGDPILFYSEVYSKTGNAVLSTVDLAEQYINEFLMAYTTALANLATRNVMVSDIPVKTQELGEYLAEVLDQEWLAKRGFYICSVGIAGISFDETTDKLLEKYANLAILMDPTARAARMTEGIAAGLEAAGANQNGALFGFAGMSMGMNAAGALGCPPGQVLAQQPGLAAAPPAGWVCPCGNRMAPDAAFCARCGSKKLVEVPAKVDPWECACGRQVTEGGFCPGCGRKRPANQEWTCQCGKVSGERFCSQCGSKRPAPPEGGSNFKCNQCGWVPDDPAQPPAFCPKCGNAFNEADSWE